MSQSNGALLELDAAAVPQGNRFKRSWTSERVLEAIGSWAEEYGKPPTSEEWEIGKPEKRAQAALIKAQLWREKARRFAEGAYPSNDTVRRFFGSFSAAIAAAGFEPRPPGRTPRELTDRQVAELRRRRNGYAASPSQLARDLRNVKEARDAGDGLALRAALFDLAATAMAWAESIPPEDE